MTSKARPAPARIEPGLVEFKVNLMAPADGERIVAARQVIRAGVQG